MSRADEAAGELDFAALLKRLRTQAGISQQTLAARAFISVQAVSALERGYRKAPYRDTLDRIANALALSAEMRAVFEQAAERARAARRLDAASALPEHNLPRQLTSFLGRDDVVAEIAAMLERSPLVSVIGTGGAGKTRTAVATATTLLEGFPQGAWFVELAPLSGAYLVADAIAGVLGIKEPPDRPVIDALVSSIGHKRMIIVLDNCEHVLVGARAAVSAILRACPNVRILATSREPLGVGGERLYRLPPLTIPPADCSSADDALSYGSVELFVDRALAVDPSFAVSAQNVTAIVEICRRLDGLPLAIELAAARVMILSPGQLAERLDRAFSVLSTGNDPSHTRHQTMRAAIDWSYALLSSQGRLLFDRVSVFAGGFSLEAATEVCSDEGIDSGDVLDLLSSLVGRSLVNVDFSRGDARYNVLEVTRQYGLEMLEQRGDWDACARRHALAYLHVAEQLDQEWYVARERAWLEQAALELDNWRRALEWSLTSGRDVAIGQRLAGALGWVWYCLSAAEGRRWIRAALATVDSSTPAAVVARLRIAEAELDGAFGEYKASLSAALRALTALEGVDEPVLLARAKQNAGTALGALGQAEEGVSLLTDALSGARLLRNQRLGAMILGDLAAAQLRTSNPDSARELYAEALATYTSGGFERQASSIAGSLAEVDFAAGDAEAALSRAHVALLGHRDAQNQRSTANVLSNMAAYLIALNRFDQAWGRAEEALAIVEQVQARLLGLFVLQHLAAIVVLAAERDPVQARLAAQLSARLLGFVDARLSEIEVRREFTEQQEYDRALVALRERISEGEMAQWFERGRQLTTERAFAEVLDAQPDSASLSAGGRP